MNISLFYGNNLKMISGIHETACIHNIIHLISGACTSENIVSIQAIHAFS